MTLCELRYCHLFKRHFLGHKIKTAFALVWEMNNTSGYTDSDQIISFLLFGWQDNQTHQWKKTQSLRGATQSKGIWKTEDNRDALLTIRQAPSQSLWYVDYYSVSNFAAAQEFLTWPGKNSDSQPVPALVLVL